MNTNSNLYTVIYTTLIVVVVAAVLAVVSQSLKGRQEANEKADTISQMMTAAGFGSKEEFGKIGNAAVLARYAEEIDRAFVVGPDGQKVADLPLEKVYSPSELKKQNYNIKGADTPELPVFIFKNGVTVVPVYGAGLWGPVWGYVAFQPDHYTIAGAYFDHESETPGLGAKIKDEAWFREKFIGKKVEWGNEPAFRLEKNAEATGAENTVDAITGATMTSKGLNEALNVWFKAYEKHFGLGTFFGMLEDHAINNEEEE